MKMLAYGSLSVALSLAATMSACSEDSPSPDTDPEERGMGGMGGQANDDDDVSDPCTASGLTDGTLTQDGVECAVLDPISEPDCGAETEITGDFATSETLSGCYFTEGFDVDEGVVLTLEPGTSIRFTDNNQGVQVRGTIVAEGTAEEPIFLYGAVTPGSWGGFRLHDGSTGNIFDHVVFENGGGFDWNTSAARPAMLVVQSQSTQVAVTNTSFSSSLEHGIHIAHPDADVTLGPGVQFADNQMAAIYLPPNQLRALGEDVRFGEDQRAEVGGGDITVDQTVATCTPWRFTDGVVIENDAHVSVSPGATLSFNSDAYLIVDGGSLAAQGTTDEAIVFTGVQKQAGSWGGINYRNETVSDENVIEHAILEYAGGFDWNTSAVENTTIAAQAQTVRLAIRESIIRDSAGLGFFANDDQSDLTISHVEFDNNEVAAADVPPNHLGVFDSTSSFGTEQDVLVRGGQMTQDTVADACVPYRVAAHLDVAVDTELTVNPNTVMRFDTGVGLDVEGDLRAIGQDGLRVVFRGVDDAPGSWGGLRFGEAANGEMEWVTIEHGGGFDWNTSASAEANLNVLDSTVSLSLDNVLIRESSGGGIYFNADPDFTCNEVEIEDSPAVDGEFDSLEAACD